MIYSSFKRVRSIFSVVNTQMKSKALIQSISCASSYRVVTFIKRDLVGERMGGVNSFWRCVAWLFLNYTKSYLILRFSISITLISFFLEPLNASASTTHSITSSCGQPGQTVGSINTVDVVPGDIIQITLIAYTNDGIPQNGCGWYYLPNNIRSADGYFLLERNLTFPNATNSEEITMLKGVNKTINFKVTDNWVSSQTTVEQAFFTGVRRESVSLAVGHLWRARVTLNRPPVANSGAGQTVSSGDAVTLNGSGTDPDGDTLTYSWTQIGGPSVTLSNSNAQNPTFTAPNLEINAPDAQLSFSLVVNDGKVNSEPSTVIVTVESIKNSAPTVTNVPARIEVLEDVESNVVLSGITFADQDTDDILTVELNVSAGTFATPSSAVGIDASGSSATVIRLVGKPDDINTYLNNPSNIRYTTAKDASGPDVARLTITASDGVSGLVVSPVVEVDAIGTPDVVSVQASPLSGFFRAGELLRIEVLFDEIVTADTGAALILDIGVGRTANLVSGSGTNTLVFEYVIQAGDTADDLDYASTGSLSGTISKATGNYAADLTLPQPGFAGSLSVTSNIVIDTTPPVVNPENISLLGATGTGGAFKIDDTITASWNTTEISEGDRYLSSSLGSVTFDFSAFGGDGAVSATFNAGTSTWTATYQVIENTSVSNTALTVSLTATDAAGNVTTVTGQTTVTVDSVRPVITAPNITISGASGTSGTFKIGDTVTATWDNSSGGDNNNDIALVIIDFTEFGGGEVNSTEINGKWTALYTITDGSIDLLSRNIKVTAIDNAGNSASLVGSNNVPVDNIAPTVVDGDISVSGGTGPSDAFKVGDSVTVEWASNNTDTIDKVEVDFSAFGGPAAVAAVESNGVWSASFILPAGSLSSSSLQISVTAFDDAGNTLTTTKATVYTANTIVPTAVVTGPTEIVTKQFTVNIEFSEAVSSDLLVSDILVVNGTVANVAPVPGSSTEFTAAIDPVLGNSVLVQVLADAVVSIAGENPNTASNEFTVFAGSVATAFDMFRDEIRKILLDEAARELRATMSMNRSMQEGSRSRLISANRKREACKDELETELCADELLSFKLHQPEVPFDVAGTANLNNQGFNSQGSFFGLSNNQAGSARDIVLGDFLIQREKGGSQTATLNARYLREHDLNDRTMVSYFVGGVFAQSDIQSTTFKGDVDRYGLTLGAAAFYRLSESIYVDGLVSYGESKNSLNMANHVLALTSRYNSKTTTVSGAVTGTYPFSGFEFRPELYLAYGETKLGVVGFTGWAYGLVDDGLRLNVGRVTITEMMLRPEFRVPTQIWGMSESSINFAPRMLCERVVTVGETKACGLGGELGLESTTADGLGKLSLGLTYDRIDGSYRRQIKLGFDKRF